MALSSQPFIVRLSVQLPSTCNAASLIATTTTQLKEVAFSQSYQMVPYIVLLLCDQNEFVEWRVAEGVSTFSRVWKIYTYHLLLQLPNRKTCLIYSHTKWNWPVDSETLDICWSDESLKQINQ